MKSFFGLVSAGFMVMGLSTVGIPANAQAPVRVHRVKSNAPAAPRPVTATPALQSQTTSGVPQNTVVSQISSSTHGTQTAKVVVRHKTGPAMANKAAAPKAAVHAGKIHPNFAGPPTVVNSVNFGNAQVAGTPVTMTLTYPAAPAASIQAAVSTTVPNGGTAPGAASDYIFFGNSNVEFGQPGGGQPVNLTNFTVSTLSNVEYPGNGSYTKVIAPGGTTAFTTGTVTENPTNYPNTTPHTQLLATFSPHTTGSFAVYILDGNTDGVIVGNSSVGLGVNGGTAVVSTSHFLSGTNEFTQFNVTNASPSDVFQVYATTSVNNYPTIGGLTFVPEAPNPLSTNLTAAATANIDFSVTGASCNSSACTANVTFTPRFPGLAYDSISLTDSSGNLVYQTYVYGTGLAPQFGYELGNETDFTNYVSTPMNVAIGPDERLYYTSSGSSTISEFARDFSSSSTVTLDGLASPSGIVVDGSNTLYVADQTNNIIISYTAAGVQGTVATTPLSGPSQLAIDGTGALYIADTGNGRVIKIDNQGNETTIASGLVSPVGVAVDSAGDVFYTNEANSNGQIYELRAGDTTAFAFQPQINQTPGYMAVDASGSVFLETDQGLNIFRAGNQIEYGATGADVAYGVAVDRNGDLLFTNPLRNTFTVDDRSSSNFILDAPPGNQTSGTVTISNTGNEPLNFSNFTVTGPQFSIDSSNNLCVLGSLSPNATCTVVIDFTPPEAQRYTDTLIVTSNSLNAPGTTDPFSLAGNGDGDSSTTTLTASPNPVASGSPVTVYITVTDSSAQYTPMGSITIMDGGSVLGTADLSAGTLAGTSTAHFTIPTLDIGDHDISAAFPGDLAVSPSTSNDVTVTATDGPPPFNGGISVGSQNFGTVAIGQSVTMSISGTPTRGSLSLANRKDFDVSIDSCSDICHYQITFNPLTPGLRTDLVSVYDDEGELEGQVYVYGIGSGPQLGFDPHPDLITQGGGIVAPTGIAIGQDGEQYTTDPGTNQVFATGGGSTVTLQILNLGKPAGIAVDAGNIVYIADQKNNLIVTYNVNSRVQGSVTTSQLNQPTGVAVDGAGDLFITDKGNNRILKIDNQGTETVLATDSVQSPRGIALDSAGDVFYTDDGNGGEIIELPATGGSPISIASSLGAVHGIAVDAAGVIYYASGTGLNLFGPAGNALALNFLSPIEGVTLDSRGDIYVTLPSSSEYVESVRGQAAYSYAANVGTSTPGTRAISNTGNTPLTISDLSISGPPFAFDSSSQCAAGTVLLPGHPCNTVVDFAPFTAGDFTGTATATSDSLNQPGSTNAIQYNGTANGNSGTNVTVTGLTVSSNSVTKGHPVIFTVTVADTLTIPPTGTVDFFNDGSYIGTATLPFTASGSAATLHFTTSSLPLGTSPITAQYFGDSNFQGSTSMVQNVTVTQPPPPLASTQNFGSVAVGQTVTGTVTFAGGGTPSFYTSNTEDFKITGYSCNSSCVVSVSFTPIFPGSRTDAIYEYDSYGNAVAEAYVYGTGTGPLFGFNPGSSSLDSTWESPNGIAISQAGVAYLSDTATNQVFVLASGVPPLPIQNLGTPGSVAVDGGGTVYVVDQTNNVIVTYNQGTQLQGSVTPTSPLSNPAEIAVDGAGSLYIADQGHNRIVKINNQGVQSSLAIGLSSPTGVAVDAAGNVYYADSGSAGEIVEVPVNGDPIVRLGTSLGSVLNLSLDASGSVYYTGSFSGIRIITPSRQNFGFTGELTGNLNGIALGPNGDIYTTQQSSGQEEQLSRATINFFTSTQVGVPVQHGGPQVFNTGNTPLTISSLALASGTVFMVDSGSICQNGLVLSPGGLCNTFVNFLPTEVQGYSDTLTFTSNNNNVAGSTNQDSETGEGTPHFFIGSRTALAVSSNSITAGQSVTLTATVTIESDVPQSTPTGTVNFFDGTTQIGSGTLTATGTVGTATASFVASSLAIGSHSITAMYGGDSSYSSSTSSVQTVVAAAGTTPSQTQLFLPTTSLVTGQSFNVQGYVTAQAGSAAPDPTGTVTFLDGSTVIGSGSVSRNGPVGTSSASINAAPLSAGTHSITAMYSGDSTYAPNTSPATTVTVSAPPPTTYNSVNFGSVSVGQTAQMTIMFSQGVNYLIRGVNDPEFTDAGGVCNTTCTMTYNFSPKYPGPREFALSAYDPGGNLVARTYLYGTGVGPQFGFEFTTDGTLNELQQPTAIAIGPDDTRYITDTARKLVYKQISGDATALPITGLVNPTGIAVDGVSKLYIADRDNNVIVTYDPVSALGSSGYQGFQGVLATSQLFHPTGVAVDAAGSVYITDTNNNRVIKVDNSGNETTLATGVANLGPIAVDAAGDVFYATTTTGGSITELPVGGGSPVVLASNINAIHGLGVDASGRVYYTNDLYGAILPPPSCTGCATESLAFAGLNTNQAYGLALSAYGDVWVTAPSVSTYRDLYRPHQTGFFQTTVGNSTLTPLPISNTGNAPLTLSGFSSPDTDFTFDPSGTCTTSTVLAPGKTCVTQIRFQPSTLHNFDEELTFTSNSLNTAGSTNLFEVEGQSVNSSGTLPSTTTLNVSAATINVGQTETLTATVAGGSNPTGTVTFFDGSTELGIATISSRVATLSVSTLSVGRHQITATYNGDTNYASSTSDPVTVTVNPAPAVVNSLNFGNVAVGQSVSMNMTYTQGTNPTISAVNNLDFVVSTVNCSTSCVATISFTPQFPGTRDDAVLVTDDNGNLLAKTYVYGVGMAPQFGFLPGSSTINTSFTFPTSITFDAAGVGYLTDAATDKVYPLVTDAQPLPIAGLGKPGGIALDGAGTFYIADKDNNRIVTYNRYTQIQGVLATSQVANPSGVAVDGTGAVYIADTGNNRIIKVDNQGVETTVASANTPQAIAVDSANNLYYSDLANNGEIIELPVAGGSPITLVQFVGATPLGVAVDASGSIYYVSSNFSGIRDVLAGGANNGQIAFSDPLTGGHSGLALNANGDIWTMQASNGVLETLHRATTSNSTSTPPNTVKSHTLQVVNTGNAPLTFSSVALEGGAFFSITSGNSCTSGSVLPPGGSCQTPVQFMPLMEAGYNDGVDFTSNTLNVDGSVNTDIEMGTSFNSLPGTGTTIAFTPGNPSVGQLVTFTSVVADGAAITPTGTVSFMEGSTQLGTGTLSASGSAQATATFSTSSLSVGTHTINAVYSGDANLASSSSISTTVTITPAPAVITSQNFGSVAVGQSGTVGIVFNLTSGNFTALTGNEFSVTSTNCTTTCTATVKFTPKFPGVREDAITVTDNSGLLLAKAYVYGIGTGPQLGFDPGMNDTFSGTIQTPAGIAIGPQSTEYITDTSTKRVWAVNGSGVNALPITGLGNPVAVAVDGGGIVYVADQVNNAIVTYNTQTGSQGTLATSGLSSPNSIAVDGAGDVFVSDLNNNRIVEINNQGAQTDFVIGLTSPQAIAVDSAGDVYYTDLANGGQIKERTSGGSTVGILSVTGPIQGLALDASGKVYFTNDNGLHTFALGGAFSNYGTSLTGTIAGVAVGPEGNIYVAQPSTGKYIISVRGTSEAFPTAAAGSSAQSPFVLTNTGNAPLTIGNIAFTSGTPYSIDPLSDCFAGSVVAAGQPCSEFIDFTPTAAQAYTSVMTITSNSLNATAAQNVYSLFGQGTSAAATSTTTSLTLSSANIIAGQSETLTALITGTEPPTITGTVTFYDVTTSLGSAPVVDPVQGDTATLMLSTLSVGTHQITATYNGDANHLGSSSSAMTVTVTAPPTVISSLNFGSVAVGQSASMNITYTEGTNPTISAVNNLDFVVSTVNCSTSCVATVSFTPQYPGQRDDAVTVKDANGNLLAKTFIYGTGTAPQFAFDIGLQTTPITYGSSGTPGPLAVGPDGTYYVADTTNNQVKAFSSNGFATLNVGTIGTPAGIAVDGAGKVYVSDPAHNRVVYELNGVPGVVPVTFSQPSFLATDGAGSLYVLDNGYDHIVKIDNQGSQTIIGTTPQASAAGGIAVDAAGNVFFVKANGDNSAVTEVGVSTTPALNVPIYAIAVDAADRLYLSAVDDATNHTAVALLSPGATAAVNYPISSSNALPPDIEVDQAGRILISEPAIGQVDIYDRSSGNISSLTASVGSSAQATVTLSNTGNTPLVLSQLAIASNGFTLGTGGTCAVGGSVAPATTCTVVVTFAPTAAQMYQGTLTIVSNSLNSTQSSNQFTLSGQGQSTGQAQTSATLQLSAANITAGQTETLTANITGGPTPVLTGTVTFYDGLTSLGSGPVTATSTGATASLSVSNLAVGSHQITASYSGDTNYLGTTTEASTVTVASAGPVVTSLNFGNVSVGQSTSMNVVYAVGANPIIRAAENHEFRVTTINCDTSCTATITFTPQYPGLRNDLVTVKNGNGDVLAKTYVYGVGTGPQFGFDPGASSVFTNIQQPTGIAVDVFGARYISDQATNQVFLVSDGTSALPITGLGKPAGVAVDGGEKVYVADQTNNVIVTYDQNAGRQGTVATTPLSSPTNIAVDGTGALYIVDAGNNRIIKIDNQGNETTLVSDVSSLGAIALDSAGDVYYSITGSPGSITELPVGGGQPIGIANNIGDIHGLAVDASNRVYYTNDAGLSIIPLPSCAGCFLEGLRNTGTGDSSYGIALGPDGNIFLTSPSTSTYALQNRATGTGSVTANVGSSVQQDPFIVSNTGNAPLTISSIAIDATAFAVDPASGCAAGTVLTPGSICNTVVNFMPSAATTYQDPLVFTSNSLNVVGSQNVFSETGTGTGTAPLTPSTTTLAVTPSNNVTVGQSVTLTATVTETTNIPPSGTVNFLDGATVIGSSFLQERANGGTSTASFTASSLAVGSHSITAMYAGNINFQASVSAAQTVTVNAPVPAPTLASISPTGGVVGSPAKTVTLTGTNFSTSDVVQLNGATISSTFVNATTLTAVLPASFFGAAGTGQIAVFDPVGGTTTVAQPFVVVAAPAIQFSGPTTGAPAQQPTLTFTLTNPYPFPIAGTLTLAFAPVGVLPVDDPSIQFSSGGRTIAFAIPALSTTTPVVQLQTGTVAGKVTVTLDVISNGVDVTPANVTPVVINIPAIAPSITTAAVTRSGNTLSVVIQGFSNTRELTTAMFHFTATNGSSISTPDITAQVGTVFATWFASAASAQYGSAFTYTQDFNLNNDASTVGTVTVTLVNSIGTSSQGTAQ